MTLVMELIFKQHNCITIYAISIDWDQLFFRTTVFYE